MRSLFERRRLKSGVPGWVIPEDGDRLVAYAARYMNPALTVALMGSRQPNVDPKARAVADGPLADLGSFDDLLELPSRCMGGVF